MIKSIVAAHAATRPGAAEHRSVRRRREMQRVASALISAVALTGCFIPSYSLVRPETAFFVHDAHGRPIEGAAVTFVSASNPYGVFYGSETLCSDSAGHVTFSSNRDFEFVHPAVIHGVPHYFATWCVDAPGYAPATRSVHSPEWGGRVHIQLAASSVAQSCEELLADAWRQEIAADAEGRRPPSADRLGSGVRSSRTSVTLDPRLEGSDADDASICAVRGILLPAGAQ